MPSESRSDALANFAYNASISATATAKAYAIVVNSLLRVLLNKGTISHPDVIGLFVAAAGLVDANQRDPETDLQKAVREHMRQMVEEGARGFGISVPPQGQTETQRVQ
jgi:hypothetical protein